MTTNCEQPSMSSYGYESKKTALTSILERLKRLEGNVVAPLEFINCDTVKKAVTQSLLGKVAVLPDLPTLQTPDNPTVSDFEIIIPSKSNNNYKPNQTLKFFNDCPAPSCDDDQTIYYVIYEGNFLFQINGQEGYTMVYRHDNDTWTIIPGIIGNSGGNGGGCGGCGGSGGYNRNVELSFPVPRRVVTNTVNLHRLYYDQESKEFVLYDP
jgi:hypothetical protein